MALAGALEIQMFASIARLTKDMNEAKTVVGGAMKNVESAVSSAKNALSALGLGFGLFKIVQLGKDMAMLAARFETLGIVMRVAGNNAGYTAAQMDTYSKQLQASGISMQQSRLAVVNLATANIDLAKATELGRAAQNLAVVGQINSSEALGRLIYGLKSGQVEVLRTMGLNVNFESGYKKLSAEIGTTSDKLTEKQKMLARTNTVLTESARYNGIYEESMTTAGKAITSLTRYWEDLKTRMGGMFLPTLSESVDDLTRALKAANVEIAKAGSQEQIASIGTGLAAGFRNVTQTVTVLGLNLAYVFNAIGLEIGGLAAQAAAIARLDFSGAAEIGRLMKADAVGNRKALDAATAAALGPKAGVSVSGMSENERMAAAAASNAAAEAEAKRLAAGIAAANAAKKQAEENKKLLDIGTKGEIDALIAREKAWREEQDAILQYQNETSDAAAKATAESMQDWFKLIDMEQDQAIEEGKAYLDALGTKGDDTFKDLENAVRGWGNAFTDTMTDMVMGGKASFSDLANSVIKDLIRMQIQQSITKPLFGAMSSALGGIFGGSSGAAPAWGGPMAAGGDYMVNRPTLFLAGEAGPERATFSGANKSGGGDINITQNMTFGSDVTQSTLVQWGEIVKRNTVAAVRDSQARAPGQWGR